jgi:hypothetical protein
VLLLDISKRADRYLCTLLIHDALASSLVAECKRDARNVDKSAQTEKRARRGGSSEAVAPCRRDPEMKKTNHLTSNARAAVDF